MIVASLAGIVVVAVLLAAVLSAAQAAVAILPAHPHEDAGEDPDRKPPTPQVAARRRRRRELLERVLADRGTHITALRFWRVWLETAAAAAGTVLVDFYLDSIWWTLLWASLGMAVVSLVIVGISPRRVGATHSLAVALATVRPVRVLTRILGPLPRWLSAWAARMFPGTQSQSYFSDMDLSDLAERAEESERIEDDEVNLITQVAGFGDTMVRAVMVPRTDMVTIGQDATLEEALNLFLRSGFSRIPVIGENADDVFGVAYLKDVAARIHVRHEDPVRTPIVKAARPVRYVPEFKPVDDLLRELQQESTHVAVVVDEYGGTAGLVTLEDILEELVGEIVDEYDHERPDVEPIGPREFRISSRLSVEDLGELFGLEIQDDDVETAGGLLAKELGQVPIPGSTAVVHGIVLTAEKVGGRRNRLSILTAAPAPRTDGEDAAATPNERQETKNEH